MTLHASGIFLAYILTLAVCLVLYLTGVLKVRAPLFVITVLVPFVGPAMLVADAIKERGYGRKRLLDQDRLMVQTASYLDVDVPDTEHDRITVPLEEAIILDDRKTRRKLLLDMLQQNRELPMEALDAASLSSDTELSHFATTAMASMQSRYEKEIQEAEHMLQDAPDDMQLLHQYWKTLDRYVSSGMLTGAVLQVYQKKLDACLTTMMGIDKESSDLVYACEENRLHLLEAGYREDDDLSWKGLQEEMEAMVSRYPDDVKTYQIYMDYARVRHDQALTRKILEAVRARNLYLNAAQREWYAFWSGDEEWMDEEEKKERASDQPAAGQG